MVDTYSYNNSNQYGPVDNREGGLAGSDNPTQAVYDKYGITRPPVPLSSIEKMLTHQFNLAGNSQLERWGALARNQAVGAGYSGAAAAQAGMRAQNRGWLSIAEQADEWARRMAELAFAKKQQAQGIDTTTDDAALATGIIQGVTGRY